MRLALIFCLFAQSAAAQDWALRAGDAPLDRSQLQALSDGASVTFIDDGTSKYSAGGAYSYTYAGDGGTAFGVFHVDDAGRVCVDYRNGFSRCDLFVRSAAHGLVLLTEKGERFPVRWEIGILP